MCSESIRQVWISWICIHNIRGSTSWGFLIFFVVFMIGSNHSFRSLLKFVFSRRFLVPASLLVSALFIYIFNSYSAFYLVGAVYFDELWGAEFFLDGNSVWRFMFWAQEVHRLFTENVLFGIGFGSPIYEIKPRIL